MASSDLFKRATSGFLDNGFKYIVHSDSQNPILCLQLYIRIGSAWEKDAEAGYAHFTEHLVFKRTKAFTENEIVRHITGLGGSLNAYTDFDSTCYYLQIPSEYLSEGLRALSELAVHPCFTAADVALEKDIICEEIRQLDSDPESGFLEFVQESCFASNPLRKPVMGTLRSVRAATHRDLVRFHTNYYQPHNSFIVIAGDADPNQLPGPINEFFGDWSNHQILRWTPPRRYLNPQAPSAQFIWRKNSQEFIAYLLPELADNHPASDPLLIAIRYLAIGRSSRLFKRLVEEEKLASAVKVTSYCGVLSGMSAIVINPVDQNHFPLIDRIFREEYRSLLRGLLDSAEFELIKTDIINGWLYGFDGMENLAGMLGAEEFISGYENLYEYDQQINPITPQQVLEAISKYWKPRYLTLIRQSLRRDEPPIHLNPGNTSFDSHPATAAWNVPDTHLVSHDPNLRQLASDYYYVLLPNGTRFLYRHLRHNPICGFALSSAASQLAETPRQRGLNYLCSASMLHSTLDQGYSDIQRFTRAHGISLNVENHTDCTVFRGKTFHKSLPHALTVLAEMIHRPRFEAEHLSLLKTATLDLLRRDRQNPASYGFQRWLSLLCGSRHPYGSYAGKISELRSRSRAEVLNWHGRIVAPEHLCLAVAGPQEPDEIHALAASLFGQQGPSDTALPTPVAVSTKPAKTRRVMQSTDSGQATIHLGGFAPRGSARAETTAFFVLSQIVGGDMDSRLFNVVREQYGYAYQIGLEFVNVEDFGYWFVYAYCDPEDHRHALKLIREILADVCAKGISAEELLQAQNYLCGMNRFELESSALQAVLMSSLNVLGYEPEFYLTREERIRAVDLDTVNRLAATWFASANQWTHILL